MKTVRLFLFFVAIAFFGSAHAQPEPKQLRGETEKLLEKAKQAKEERRPEEAEELFKQAKKLEARARESQDAKEHGDKVARTQRDKAERVERKRAEVRDRKREEGLEFQSNDERFRHVMEAVKHLHAAGFHEPAGQVG